MIISVDPERALPVYEQIREQVVRMVTAGTLAAGTRLPTIRQLASDLGLAKGTVSKAYELLESEAVIATRGRSGSFVLEPTRTEPRRLAIDLDAAAESLVITARQLGADHDSVQQAVAAAWQRF